MVRILTRAEERDRPQYEHLFSLESATLEFTRRRPRQDRGAGDGASTGARGLRAVMDELMVDLLYELPDRTTKA